MFPSNSFVLLHNPACSKSRAAKALLESRQIEFVERHYLLQPLNAAELHALVVALGNPDGSVWLRLDAATAGARLVALGGPLEPLIELAVGEPSLLQRPILVRGDAAAVGRPMEQLEAMLPKYD